MALKNPITGGTWNTLTLNSSHVSDGAPYLAAAYRKDSFGIVYLRGKVRQVSTYSDPLFTLPVGFRPVANCRFLLLSINGSGGNATIWVEMKSTGLMNAIDGDVSNFFLDQISFATY